VTTPFYCNISGFAKLTRKFEADIHSMQRDPEKEKWSPPRSGNSPLDLNFADVFRAFG
jgi:hypothetical protein